MESSLAASKLMVYLMKYIQGSLAKVISGRSFILHMFSNSDWAGDRVTRQTTTGYIMFACSGPIVWRFKSFGIPD